jgi:hypothetical protein
VRGGVVDFCFYRISTVAHKGLIVLQREEQGTAEYSSIDAAPGYKTFLYFRRVLVKQKRVLLVVQLSRCLIIYM